LDFVSRFCGGDVFVATAWRAFAALLAFSLSNFVAALRASFSFAISGQIAEDACGHGPAVAAAASSPQDHMMRGQSGNLGSIPK
jgi:hypothetical protein